MWVSGEEGQEGEGEEGAGEEGAGEEGEGEERRGEREGDGEEDQGKEDRKQHKGSHAGRDRVQGPESFDEAAADLEEAHGSVGSSEGGRQSLLVDLLGIEHADVGESFGQRSEQIVGDVEE
eukprot:764073-Hanusia_phi.AAC.4